MTDNPSTTSVALPDAPESAVTQTTQYGMRYPDGSIAWEVVEYYPGISKQTARVEHLATSNGSHNRFTLQQDWKRYLERVARDAKLADVEAYVAAHQVITRQVIVSITEPVPAEVKPALAVPPAPAANWLE